MAYKKGRDHLIWTDDPEYLNLEDWDIDELIEINDWDPADYESETSRWDIVAEINDTYLDDERANLDINVGSTIYAIADVGRWNGRAAGYKEIKSGNLSDCLYANVNGMSYCTWYVTRDGEFCLDESHHDGTNYVVYRVERDDLTDEEYENLHYEDVTTEQLWDYTRPLGSDIAQVYGWSVNVSSATDIHCEDEVEDVEVKEEVTEGKDSHKLIEMLREGIANYRPNSAWERGKMKYAEELVDELEESIEGGYTDPTKWTGYQDFYAKLLNGADSWNQYSWGGSSLIYDGDIAERLCSPSELKKTRGGERRPNSREEWLDVQARALSQVARFLLNHGAREYIEMNKH